MPLRIAPCRTTCSPPCPTRNSRAWLRTWSWSRCGWAKPSTSRGARLQHAHFPTTAIVSLLHTLSSGVSAEVAGVGNEGVLGIALFMGGDTTPTSAVVQTAGHGYRLSGKVLKDEFDRAGLVHRLLLRYTQALVTQIFQSGACNRHHYDRAAAVPVAVADPRPHRPRAS